MLSVSLGDQRTPDECQKERRRERWRLRELAQTFSAFRRIQLCGKHRTNADGPVAIYRREDGAAYYGNLQRCASVHACPVCSAKIRQARANEITAAVERHLAAGGAAEFVTLTLRHHAGQSLNELLDGCVNAFRWITAHREWRALRDELGQCGTIRALEITHGHRNGWHPHLHVLVLFEKPLTRTQRHAFSELMLGMWQRAVIRQGHALPQRGPACKVVQVRDGKGIGAYTSKVIGLELQRHDLKRTRRARIFGTRPVFSILRDLADIGDADDLALWLEHERATHGRRSLTWSRGLKDRLAIGEVTDDEIVELPENGRHVISISPPSWSLVVKHRQRFALLELAELEDGAERCDELLAKLEYDAWETLRC